MRGCVLRVKVSVLIIGQVGRERKVFIKILT